jgi:ribosome maturation factor RimP
MTKGCWCLAVLLGAVFHGTEGFWLTRTTTRASTAFHRRRCHHWPLAAVLPEGYQQAGNELIYGAAASCGVPPEQLEIQWKAGKIHVEVRAADVYLSDAVPRDDERVEGDVEDEGNVDDDTEDTELALEEDDDNNNVESIPDEPSGAAPKGVDMTILARAINAALDDDGVGLAIAEVHAIEVSTPGATDELSGIMFESYKGFDVLVQHMDPKKKSIKTIEGRLVERNEEFTVLNLKGRFKKLKNAQVVSVKLPKAKREKGGR